MSETLVRLLVDAGADPASAQRTSMFLDAGVPIAEAAEWLELDDAIESDPAVLLFEALLTELARIEVISR